MTDIKVPREFYSLGICLNDARSYTKIQIKSRVGTGSSSSSSPCSLTFSFAPAVVMLLGRVNKYTNTAVLYMNTQFSSAGGTGTSQNYPGVYLTEATTSYSSSSIQGLQSYGYNGRILVKKSSDGKTLYWYSSGDSDGTNTSNGAISGTTCTYFFLAFTV